MLGDGTVPRGFPSWGERSTPSALRPGRTAAPPAIPVPKIRRKGGPSRPPPAAADLPTVESVPASGTPPPPPTPQPLSALRGRRRAPRHLGDASHVESGHVLQPPYPALGGGGGLRGGRVPHNNDDGADAKRRKLRVGPPRILQPPQRLVRVPHDVPPRPRLRAPPAPRAPPTARLRREPTRSSARARAEGGLVAHGSLSPPPPPAPHRRRRRARCARRYRCASRFNSNKPPPTQYSASLAVLPPPRPALSSSLCL